MHQIQSVILGKQNIASHCINCIKSFLLKPDTKCLRSRSSVECCLEIDWGLRAAMKVLMKIKSPNVWHGGDAVCVMAGLLSPLHHQNVPQKLPAGIKPGIKLEHSVPALLIPPELCQWQKPRGAKYSLIRLCGLRPSEAKINQLSCHPGPGNCFRVFCFLFQLSIYLFVDNESRKGAEVFGRSLLTGGSERSQCAQVRMSPSLWCLFVVCAAISRDHDTDSVPDTGRCLCQIILGPFRKISSSLRNRTLHCAAVEMIPDDGSMSLFLIFPSQLNNFNSDQKSCLPLMLASLLSLTVHFPWEAEGKWSDNGMILRLWCDAEHSPRGCLIPHLHQLTRETGYKALNSFSSLRPHSPHVSPWSLASAPSLSCHLAPWVAWVWWLWSHRE